MARSSEIFERLEQVNWFANMTALAVRLADAKEQTVRLADAMVLAARFAKMMALARSINVMA